MPLPPILTVDDYRSFDLRDPAHAQAVREVCARHGLPQDPLHQFPNGSSIVYAAGDRYVVKLYPPVFADEFRTETGVLGAIAGSLSTPTPEVVAVGTLDEWSYLVMTRMEGEELKSCWGEIPQESRIELARQLGLLVRGLHAIPLYSIPLPDDWAEFVSRQIEECVSRHTRLGLESWMVDLIPPFLASLDPALRAPTPRVLLHTEVMVDHLFAHRSHEKSLEGWRLSGLIDFEPAMIGHPEYEFAAVGLFVAGGDPLVFNAFLDGYGYARSERGRGLAERVMAYTLMHRYSNLIWYLRFMPQPERHDTFASLATRWFGTESESVPA
jgi:hygromycin-B 7''-O-kinase